MANHNMLKVDGTNLREMTDDEQVQWFGHNCLLDWANGDSNLPGKLTKVKIGSNKYNLVGSPKDHAWTGANIGDGIDTYVGPSEVTQAFLYQRYDSADVMADSDKNTYAPMMWIDRPSGTGLKQMEDSDINNVIDGILGETLLNEGIGTYRVGHTSPTPVGDWTARFTLLTDTNVQNGTEDVYKIWQRTGMPLASVDSGANPVFILDSSQGGSTKYDIREHGPDTWASKWKTRFHERMRETKIGTYQLRLVGDGVPTDPGTWVEKGRITDSLAAFHKGIGKSYYSGSYEQTFIRYFTGYYTSEFLQPYTSEYTGNYIANYIQDYERVFSRLVNVTYTTAEAFTGQIDYISGDQNPNYENRTTNYVSGYQREPAYQVSGPSWILYFQRNYLGVGLWPAYQRIRGLFNRSDGISTYTLGSGRNSFFTNFYVGQYPFYYSGSTRWNQAYFAGVFQGPGPMYYQGPGSAQYQSGPIFYYTGPELAYATTYVGPSRYEGNIYYLSTGAYENFRIDNYTTSFTEDYQNEFVTIFSGSYSANYESFFATGYIQEYIKEYERNYSGTSLDYINYMGPSRNFYTLGGVQDYVLYVRVA